MARFTTLGFCLVLAFATSSSLEAIAQGSMDDWALVKDAQERFMRYDFSGALEQLDRVDPSSDAAADGRLVRQQVQDAMAPHLFTEATHFYDTQPLQWMAQRVGSSFWVTPRFKLALQSHRRWDGDAVVPTGTASLDARWLDPLRLQLRAEREELSITEAAIIDHILVDSAAAAAGIHGWHGWYVELRYEERLYSDANAGRAAHAWGLAPLLHGAADLAVGYAVAYADTANDRWDVPLQRYLPYFTPLDAWRHGPVLAAGLKMNPVTVRASGEVSAQATETDPNSDFLGVRVLRDWFYAKAEGSAELTLGDASVRLSHRYEHQSYYRYHETTFTLDMALP